MLVSVEGVPELKSFSEIADAIEIGAGLTLSEVEERWTSAPAVVREWFTLFASPLIRNRATLGGNLATASPVGDSAPLLLALDTEVRAAGPDGVRSISLCDFFTGYRQTALRPGELIVSLRVPKPLPSHLAFYKAAKRTMDDISTVAAAFAIDINQAGRITRARAAYGGVAATPVLLADFAVLAGRKWNRAAMHHAQQAVAAALTPLSDHRGSAAYRLALSQSLIENSGGRPGRRTPHEPGRSDLPHESATGHVITARRSYRTPAVPFSGPAARLAVLAPHAHAELEARDTPARWTCPEWLLF
jgi:xanthine dehydrogenase small subunit